MKKKKIIHKQNEILRNQVIIMRAMSMVISKDNLNLRDHEILSLLSELNGRIDESMEEVTGVSIPHGSLEPVEGSSSGTNRLETDVSNNPSFGENIRFILKKKGMKQRELANQCQISETTLSRYLAGKRVPNMQIVCKMAAVLNVDIRELLADE